MKAGQDFGQRFLGKSFPLSAPLDGHADATLLLFVSGKCHYCAESMPFYQRLANLRLQAGFRIIAAVPKVETREENIAKFESNHVALDGLEPLSFLSLGVSGTPTLLLLDRSKVVKAIWTGKLNPEQEKDVLANLKLLCRECRI